MTTTTRLKKVTDVLHAKKELFTTNTGWSVHLVEKTAINVMTKPPALNVNNQQYQIRLAVVENAPMVLISKKANVNGAA